MVLESNAEILAGLPALSGAFQNLEICILISVNKKKNIAPAPIHFRTSRVTELFRYRNNLRNIIYSGTKSGKPSDKKSLYTKIFTATILGLQPFTNFEWATLKQKSSMHNANSRGDRGHPCRTDESTAMLSDSFLLMIRRVE